MSLFNMLFTSSYIFVTGSSASVCSAITGDKTGRNRNIIALIRNGNIAGRC